MVGETRPGAGPAGGRARSLGTADVGPVARLLEAARPGAWSRGRLAAEGGRADALGCLVEAAGSPVAVALGRLVLDELHVLEVATDPAHRRRGHGRAVVAALLEAAKARGARTALLELRASNAPAAALYASIGFVVVGERPRYYPDGESATLMTHRLRGA